MAIAIALFEQDERASLARWAMAAALVLAAHVGVVAAYHLIDWPKVMPPGEVPAIMIELAPMPVAPTSQSDAAPGPEVMQSDEAAPLKPPETPRELIEPLPKIETPAVVTLPDLRPVERPVEQTPPEEKPPVVREQRTRAALQTSPSPRSERPPAPVARAPAPGVNPSPAPAVSPSWVSQVTAHINRHKRYPADAHGAHGTVAVAFTVDRHGRILSRRVAKSSGVSALDAEALAALQRAQPLPAFPPSMTNASISVTAPFVFVAR